MGFRKLKKIIASVTVFATLFSNTAVYAATANSSSTANSTAKSTETSSTTNENVLNVNVDDNGSVDYTVPNSSESRENQQFSWDNASVYFVMTDRFYNGDTSNDHSYGRSKDSTDAVNYATRQGTFHGGDLKGLTEKLDEGYFDKLGINAIWITAPYEQIHGAVCSNGFKHYPYEGYWTLDFTNMDANMGTTNDLSNFIDTAHTHGIRVVFDIVMNHVGYADPVTANEYDFGKLSPEWKDVYYKWDESKYKWYYDYDVEAAANGQSDCTMMYDGDWTSKWWGTDWIRAVSTRFKGYEGSEQGSDITMCTSGLPDLKTESSNPVELPPILVNKWKKEGTYDEHVKELNDWFAAGHDKSVTSYMVKWLTDWVRKYGVDGFRCDTAKHVPLSSWKMLKTEAEKALKEWRTANPNKPGAEWTDNFWMTGEVFGAEAGTCGDYFDNGFDSIINFQWHQKDSGTKAFTSYGGLNSVYSDYDNKINHNSKVNYLTYISSHDVGLARGGNMKVAGTNLLLCPGAVQIFYGDETNRPAVGTDSEMGWRSQMNWDSIDNAVLAHWQKVGTFRNNHIAVGAGTHTKLNDSPYTFSRTYYNNDVEDGVVCCLPGKSGAYDVKTADVFADGQIVRDAYSGKTYTAKGGTVEGVTCDENGVILLEAYGLKPTDISVKPGNTDKTYSYENTLDLTFTASEKATDTKYSINGKAEKTFTDKLKLTIGSGLKNGDLTTIKITGYNEDGKKLEKTYVYKKIVIPYDEGYVYAKKPSGWGDKLYAYIYDESTGTAKSVAKWPGVEMTFNDEYQRYELQIPDEFKTDKTQVIFTDGANQVPGSKQPGVFYKTGKAMVFDGSEISLVDPTINQDNSLEPGEISTDKESGQYTGTDITVSTTDATGGSGNYTYKFTVTDENGNEKDLTSYGSKQSVQWTPDKAGQYTLTVYVKDSEGNQKENSMTYNVTKKPVVGPTITSFKTNLSSGQYAGTKIKIGTGATGSGKLQYKFVISLNGKEMINTNYINENCTMWTPTEGGNYTITGYVKDENGEETSQVISSYEIKTNPLVISKLATSLTSPSAPLESVKMSALASGTGNIKYRFVVLDSEGKAVYVRGYSSRTYAPWTPEKAGKYTIFVKAKDATGKEAVKSIPYEVEEISGCNIMSINTSLVSPQSAGKSINITVSAKSQKAISYKYFIYNFEEGWTLLSDYTSKNTVTWKPSKKGDYVIFVEAKDTDGNTDNEVISYKIQ